MLWIILLVGLALTTVALIWVTRPDPEPEYESTNDRSDYGSSPSSGAPSTNGTRPRCPSPTPSSSRVPYDRSADDYSGDLLDPLNPLSPLSPISPLNLINQDDSTNNSAPDYSPSPDDCAPSPTPDPSPSYSCDTPSSDSSSSSSSDYGSSSSSSSDYGSSSSSSYDSGSSSSSDSGSSSSF